MMLECEFVFSLKIHKIAHNYEAKFHEMRWNLESVEFGHEFHKGVTAASNRLLLKIARKKRKKKGTDLSEVLHCVIKEPYSQVNMCGLLACYFK